MHYQINVAKNGKHVFATAEHSLRDEKPAISLAQDFAIRFPESEGYEITLRYYECSGQRVDFKTK